MAPLRAKLAQGLYLLSIGFFDLGTPLVRMICLSHLLSLEELGFISAISAVAATLEQVTNMDTYRCVFSTSREDFDEALAGAHAVGLLRGCTLAAIMLLGAPMVAHLFGRSQDWTAFAFIGVISFARSLEHLEMRVAERDYRYDGQFRASLVANVGGLLALLVVALIWRNHNALLAALFAQSLLFTIMSHWVATRPFRISFVTPFFRRAWNFGFPLMFNGAGLAAVSQGDRIIVGALLGLPTLAVYSVSMLAAIVPISVLFRVVQTIGLAGLYNARVEGGQLNARLQAYATMIPILAGLYACGLLMCLNPAIGFVFGPAFVVDNWALTLLTLNAFFQIARTEPFTALLLHEGRTAALAMTNIVAISGLATSAALCWIFPSLLSPLVGRLGGEVVSLITGLRVTRDVFRVAQRHFLSTFSCSLAVILVAVGILLFAPMDLQPLARVEIMFVFFLGFLVWAGLVLPKLLNEGYRAGSA
jgi:O-antigen/teichoic acid export membrane protein